MAIFNRIFGKKTVDLSNKEFRVLQSDIAYREYVESQRIAAADTRVLI